MKVKEKFRTAISESNNPDVISDVIYEMTTPKEHKELLSFLIDRFLNEKSLLNKFANNKSDAINIEASEFEKIESDFEGYVLDDQFNRALAGN